jgi:hypothetical protein
MRGVSYFQSVFDLLGLQPQTSSEALAMIEVLEQGGRRLPESVRQWYLIENVVSLPGTVGDWRGNEANEANHLWYDYSNQDHPQPLAVVLEQFRQVGPTTEGKSEPKRVRVLVENQAVCSWYLQLDDTDDPPVVVDEAYFPSSPEGEKIKEWVQVAPHFSDFIFDWFAGNYFHSWTPYSEAVGDGPGLRRTRPNKPYLNGLWLFAPNAEPLAPPHLDFLLEQFTEEARRQLADGVEQYDFRNADGRLRVTTDRYGEPDGVSAWWLHADTEEGLFQLAKRVLWCGSLRSTLRHWTKSARPVMDRLKALSQV